MFYKHLPSLPNFKPEQELIFHYKTVCIFNMKFTRRFLTCLKCQCLYMVFRSFLPKITSHLAISAPQSHL